MAKVNNREISLLPSELTRRATATAERLMAEDLPRRWRHVQSVAAKAEALSPAFGDSGPILVAAAWLHDVGYAEALIDTGFHPLDGALYLRHGDGWGAEICSLVANHSAAAAEAELRGLTRSMTDFPDNQSAIRDALWTCDMTTSPIGNPTSFGDRLAEIRSRYGESHTLPCALGSAADEIRSCITRTKAKAAGAGLIVDLRV